MLLSDNDDNFDIHVDKVRKEGHDTVVIFGCGEGLNDVSQFQFNAMYGKYLTIGINDVYRRFNPHYLFYSDSVIHRNISKSKSINVYVERNTKNQIYNIKHFRVDGFYNWDKNGLIFFRTTLVPVLHFCYLVGIKRIVLCGMNFDNRRYFYADDIFPDGPYERVPRMTLDGTLCGYSMHKSINNVLSFLSNENSCEIIRTDKSDFFDSLNIDMERLNWV